MKGIILAGGCGSRLYPLTFGTSKHLLPVYDKPMIYYPLSILMRAGIKDILIISTPKDLPRFKYVFNDGSGIGLNITYKIQNKPVGIAEAFLIANDFIESENVCLILGDNIFHGKNIDSLLNKAKKNLDINFCTIFGIEVENPQEFGVIEFDQNNKIIEIVEKPKSTNSKLIVSGLYFYPNNVIEIASKLKPSSRGELEITDINNFYIRDKKIDVIKLDSEFIWIDSGTYESLIEASKYFHDIEIKTGNKVACIEEIAFNLGYINRSNILDLANSMNRSDYGKYILRKFK